MGLPGNKNAVGNRGGTGRPPTYDPESHPERAFKLTLLGLTDAQLGTAFGVDEKTINRWKAEHPEFLSALTKGKDDADAHVADSLYKRATGYEHPAVKIVADAKTGTEHIVEYVERYPPDTTAGIFWLKNRQSGKWRDRHHLAVEDPDEVLARVLGVPKEELP